MWSSQGIHILVFLAAAAAGLFLMHWMGVVSASVLGTEHVITRQLLKLFWLDSEYNIPSWFSSGLHWTSGLLLIFIAFFIQPERENFSRYWFFLGLVFLCLSMDETVALHEWLIIPVREALGTSGIFHFAWIIPAIVLLVIGFLAYIPFLMYLPGNLRILFLVSGGLFVFGAIGMEMLGGAAKSGEIGSTYYQIVMPIEEILEKSGIILFIFGLVNFIVAKK